MWLGGAFDVLSLRIVGFPFVQLPVGRDGEEHACFKPVEF